MEKKVGHYAFIIGVILAIVLGLFAGPLSDATTWIVSLLVVLGLIVGFINVTGKETKDFLLAATVLIIAAFAGGAASTLGDVVYIGPYLGGIFTAVMAFVVPATIIVALKDIWMLGQNK